MPIFPSVLVTMCFSTTLVSPSMMQMTSFMVETQESIVAAEFASLEELKKLRTLTKLKCRREMLLISTSRWIGSNKG
ncbi:hypothetical protein EV424DRAFT_1365009 [Suillus variegatus]|nr:hypothetical protein EV424DRAFT_1365009 [Suillus variegatus]